MILPENSQGLENLNLAKDLTKALEKVEQ